MENSNSTGDTVENKENKLKIPQSLMPSHLDPFSRRLYVREMLKKMPSNVQNRVTLLKNLQVDYHKLQVDYFREIFELEKKFHEKYQKLYDQRARIVSGEVDPPEEPPRWKSDSDEIDKDIDMPDFSEYLKDVQELPGDIKGVPDFWLNIFRNSDTLAQMIFDQDIVALKALKDVQIRYNDENSYTLEFHFGLNPYFANSILTKQYFLKNTVDEEYPFGFEGLEIYKSSGCKIYWKEKMDLTSKTVRKREKHKETGALRTVVKHLPKDSFFNFFNPPKIEADKLDGVAEEIQEILRLDFEIGHFLREEIIPKAVLYYTGDIIDDEEDEESFESDEGSAGGEPDEGELDIKRVAELLSSSIHN